MNRAFFIVIIPALFVAAAYLGLYYGKMVPRPVAYIAAGVAAIGIVRQLGRSRGGKSAEK